MKAFGSADASPSGDENVRLGDTHCIGRRRDFANDLYP